MHHYSLHIYHCMVVRVLHYSLHIYHCMVVRDTRIWQGDAGCTTCDDLACVLWVLRTRTQRACTLAGDWPWSTVASTSRGYPRFAGDTRHKSSSGRLRTCHTQRSRPRPARFGISPLGLQHFYDGLRRILHVSTHSAAGLACEACVPKPPALSLSGSERCCHGMPHVACKRPLHQDSHQLVTLHLSRTYRYNW